MPKTDKTDELSFEQGIERLENIVEAMESGDLPLETLLQRFEDGTRLVKLCQSRLEQAELQIQKLEKDSGGKTTAKPVGSSLLNNE